MSGLALDGFPVLGSALALSLEYIDLGNWLAAIEGGIHFGFDYLLVLIFITCTGILCQYLSNCIGLVTRKNLVQICSEEYGRFTCILLGIAVELSMIASELTKILGIAHGFNVLFGLDQFACVFLAATIAFVVPFLFTLLGSYKLEVLYISLSSFTVFFYVLGMFASHPENSSVIHGRYSELNLETTCSIMVLLGANIMPHNFYIHSSIAQQHKRERNVSAAIHDQLYAILSSFAIIFLVNYVMMTSAASVFNGLFMPTSQDAFMLMDQVSSSYLIMGTFRISRRLEIFAMVAFTGIFASSFIFTINILFRKSGWIVELRGDEGSTVTFLCVCFVFLALSSLGFTLYVAVTPLRSSGGGNLEMPKAQAEQSEYQKETDSTIFLSGMEQNSESGKTSMKPLESQCDGDSTEFDIYWPETGSVSENDYYESALGLTTTAAFISQIIHEDDEAVLDEVFANSLSDTGILPSMESRCGTEENNRSEAKGGSSENLMSSTTAASSASSEFSKNTNADISTNQKETISGLSRAVRLQLAAILDEFWGLLFDFHGQLTEEAKGILAGILLGLEFDTTKTVGAKLVGNELSQRSSMEAEKPLVFSTISQKCNNEHNPKSTLHAETPISSIRCDSEIPSYNEGTAAERYSDCLRKSQDQLQSGNLAFASCTGHVDQFMCSQDRSRFGSLPSSGIQNSASSTCYNEPFLVEASSPSGHIKEKHNYSGSYLSSSHGSNLQDYLYDEHLPNLNFDFIDMEVPLMFEELPASTVDNYSSQPVNSDIGIETLWSMQQFEQQFSPASATRNWGGKIVTNKSSRIISYRESESLVLESLAYCIVKLLRLEGSNWLFSQSGGCDEELIDRLAVVESLHIKEGTSNFNESQWSEVKDVKNILQSLPHCGDGCVWQASLLVSFGVWCVRTILELLLVERRPELWGKYTYVLNRLQGILCPAFSKPREFLSPCECLKLPEALVNEFQNRSSVEAQCTTASSVLKLIKEIEAVISGRKGRSGTAAGNIAYPKGKENLASVLKRYKRRLSKMSDPQ